MGDVLSFPRPASTDGGKARIQRRRELIGLAKQGSPVVEPDSLVMLRADEPRCRVIVPKPEHRRARNREHDAKRRQEKPWRAFYNTHRWKVLRLGQLRREPLCKRCHERGVIRAATVAHHVVAHKGDEQLFYDANNLASSCADCHDVDEQRIERGGKARQSVGADGWPIEASRAEK